MINLIQALYPLQLKDPSNSDGAGKGASWDVPTDPVASWDDVTDPGARLEPDIEPGAILEEVTAPGASWEAPTDPTANCGDVAVPVRTPANWIVPRDVVVEGATVTALGFTLKTPAGLICKLGPKVISIALGLVLFDPINSDGPDKGANCMGPIAPFAIWDAPTAPFAICEEPTAPLAIWEEPTAPLAIWEEPTDPGASCVEVIVPGAKLEPVMEPGAILEALTAPGASWEAPTDPAASWGDVAIPVRTPANWIVPRDVVVAGGVNPPPPLLRDEYITLAAGAALSFSVTPAKPDCSSCCNGFSMLTKPFSLFYCWSKKS